MKFVVAVVAFVTLSACGSSTGDDADRIVDDPPAETSTSVEDVDESAVESGATDPSTTGDAAGDADVQKFPDVIGADAVAEGATWTVSATLSSPYDTPERYADAWRVVGPDGTVYGERVLTHDHASEQPFTRSESGIEIPDDVTTVTIEGRDQLFGYGGDTFELTLPR